MYTHTFLKTPVGLLKLVASERGLVAVLWENDERLAFEPSTFSDSHALLQKVTTQLEDYFAGRLETFDVPLDFQGTVFQKNVWAQLLKIPFGETRSYGEIAATLGRPKASRAVGAANGMNPISIIAPCHRVIGAKGALTGFAGGLETKKFLLQHEGALKT